MSEQTDFRYGFTVTLLVREDRPNYWDFHCNYCTRKVAEVDGDLIRLMDIRNDAGDGSRPSVSVKCPGTNHKWCPMWYSFITKY